MKVTDLMIGDLLKWKEQPGFNDEDRNMVLRVKRIYDDSIKIDGRFELYHISLFEPIPLTPEILEKNGFVVESKYSHGEPLQYYILVDDGLWINISGENFFEGKLEYVHQLQHALKLCGIEKTIEL